MKYTAVFLNDLANATKKLLNLNNIYLQFYKHNLQVTYTHRHLK